MKKKALKMRSRLVISRAFFLTSPEKTVKLISKVNQQSLLNLYIFHHFPKNLDRTITFNSVTHRTEPQKYIIFLTKQIIFRVRG